MRWNTEFTVNEAVGGEGDRLSVHIDAQDPHILADQLKVLGQIVGTEGIFEPQLAVKAPFEQHIEDAGKKALFEVFLAVEGDPCTVERQVVCTDPAETERRAEILEGYDVLFDVFAFDPSVEEEHIGLRGFKVQTHLQVFAVV